MLLRMLYYCRREECRMLKFSKRNALLQLALNYADTGELPDYRFANEEERTYFERSVAEIKDDRAKGYHFEYSVGDYDDDEDNDDPWGSL